jgi:hypothetical protein
VQSSTTVPETTDVKRLQNQYRRGDLRVFLIIFVVVLGVAPMLIVSGLSVGFGLVIGVSLAVMLTLLVVRWPIVGLFVTMACAVTIEETALSAGTDFTDHLYIFNWPDALQGLPDRPIGFLLLLVLVVLVISRLMKRTTPLEGGPLILPFGLFMLTVVMGVIHGLATGGQLKIIVIEARPLWYLFITYILAYNLFTNLKQVKALFWIVILGEGFKGLQGLYILYVVLKGDTTGQDSLIAHEDSYFFAALLLLIVLFCICCRYRAQLITALIVLPAVVISMVANQRRADYIAMLLGMAVAWIIVIILRPQNRKSLIRTGVIVVIIGGAYVGGFSHVQGSFASPARSIVAVFSPSDSDIRDIQSNLYRIVENHDLKYTESQNPILGLGFGKSFSTPWPLINISVDDPYYLFIPHNTIYWIWADLGPLGALALWYLFGSIIVRGTLIVRNLKLPYLQLAGIFAIAIVIMEIVIAFADYQLFFYRPVLYVGLFVGLLAKLPKIERHELATSSPPEEQELLLPANEQREMQAVG